MNRTESAMRRMITRLQEAAGIVITYYVNATTYIELDKKAWLGKQLFRIIDGERSRAEWSDKDFLLPVADLVIGGNPVEPARGHWIMLDGVRYRLSAPDNEPVWRFSDPQNLVYRLHTKKG